MEQIISVKLCIPITSGTARIKISPSASYPKCSLYCWGTGCTGCAIPVIYRTPVSCPSLEDSDFMSVTVNHNDIWRRAGISICQIHHTLKIRRITVDCIPHGIALGNITMNLCFYIQPVIAFFRGIPGSCIGSAPVADVMPCPGTWVIILPAVLGIPVVG